MTGTGAFGRDRRVRKRRDFQRVQSIGRRVVTAHFVLLLAAQPAGDAPGPARLGLVVSRKVGNAVARNRVKRVCRASFRLLPDLLPAGVDLVVIARDGAETLGLREVRAEWTGVSRLLRRRAQEALAQTDGKTHLSPR